MGEPSEKTKPSAIPIDHVAPPCLQLFTATDYAILRKAMTEVLTELECQIVILRFWQNMLLEEISEALTLPIPIIEQMLFYAFRKIKEFCYSDRNFSRKQESKNSRKAA